ncbi:phenylalanyl-tRNA synthetase beta subunit [Roseimicrobium gellanilyticum]|uniref:Phenylalanine--tRNA ligase beta subunit n=1 Tax=Roseimicrobium gellanilyticum TaxID=748857 RepID=A0A366HNU1_9BACT|nr:phenylalanine--tRNA ligase subunit beta [Roseimicrobium gellanilyticum]RBP44245.1 phenylalanyl-tRNA synthetase beta subunit [Roseimicrobium gellanilyticum]
MKVSLSWLKTHLDLADASVESLRDLLTFAGIEVEGIEVRGVDTDKIVVAQILESVQHPNADRLSVAQVDDGSGTKRQIVCGAKNYKVGDKVPLALPGAKLPGGIEIKEGKLRDVQSNGMMCSGRELGIGEDHSGLLILDPALKVGSLFKEIVPPDVVFDLEITPNRSDLLSHSGLARELAALTGKALKSAPAPELPEQEKASKSQVRLDAPDACPYYTARYIRGVKVGPSPEWLRRRLESVGLRPINNVVDITNYVLLEVGQPLHAFDMDKLEGGIIVRHASEGESLVALDGNSYTLNTDDLVIADKACAVAIAGVMGGNATSVTETTANILLESAYFTPSQVRRTSRRLILSSDSSYRFERGVDPQGVLEASALATKLIVEIAGGKADEEVIVAGKAPVLVKDIVFDELKAKALIGIPDLDRYEMHKVLSSLGLQLLGAKGRDSSKWQIPSHRLDLQRSIDLVEEVARVVGLDRVPSRAAGAFSPAQATDRTYDFTMTLRQALVERGFYEAQTLRLISTSQLKDVLGQPVTPEKSVAVRNALSEDHTTLRPSLVPGLLATTALNIRQGLQRLRFFEIGRVFLMNPNGTNREEERVAILMSGPAEASSWAQQESPAVDVFHLRGVLETIPGIAGSSIELVPKPLEGWLLSAEVKRGSKTLGWIAQVHPARVRELDARHPVYVTELSLSALQQGAQGTAKFTELQRYPSITRDVALEVPADLPTSKIAAFFASQKEPLLAGAEVFDVFADPTGQKLASDKKSVAWSLTYRATDRTLESKEVDEAHSRVLKALVGTLPATIR